MDFIPVLWFLSMVIHIIESTVLHQGPLLGHVDPPQMRKRLISSNPSKYWDHGIVPYVFLDELPSAKRRNYVDNVFPVFEKYSCIRFVRWDESTKQKYNLPHNNYLRFNDNRQCSSSLGNTRNNGQGITCCTGRTCVHEIGHALGFLHEHRSPLRHFHSRINFENIKQGLGYAFKKAGNDAESYGIYDYDSVMHYAIKAFSSNNEPTITYLDQGIKPASAVADRDAYFYFFMEINGAYKCTDHCQLDCVNGGYPAIVDGACACRCPEGLDPATQCNTLLQSGCGEIIELSDSYLFHEVISPVTDGKKRKTCYWFFKSPVGTRVVLDFPVFKVREEAGGCHDEVAVRHYLPGLYGKQYCGDVFKPAVISTHNQLAFSFTQSPHSGTGSKFLATITLVKEADFCYNISTRGELYNSAVGFGDNSKQCLPWDAVTSCRHHMFHARYVGKRLESNYCRNPDGSDRPWCYTDLNRCERAYCDACQIGSCRNTDDDCRSHLNINPRYCEEDPQAPTVCRKKCGFCNGFQPLPSVATTTCGKPILPPDSMSTSLQDSYEVGSTVRVECLTNADYKDITCLSNGQWTPLNFVCGTCNPGWTEFDGVCYKMFDDKKNQDDAKTTCEAACLGCRLLQIPRRRVGNFVAELTETETGNCEPIWTGLTTDETGTYRWEDGATPSWTDWVEDGATPSGKECVAVNMFCNWKDKGCGVLNKFVCEYDKSEPVLCADQRNDCADILHRTPELCTSHKRIFGNPFCAKTCGFC